MIRKIRFLLLFSMTFILWIAIPKYSNCADGKLAASVSRSSSNITVTIRSSKSLGAFTLTATGANPISTTSMAGGDANGNIINGSSITGVKTLGKFVFAKPSKETNVTFSVSGCEDKDMNPITISSTSVTLKADSSNSNSSTNNTTSDTSKTKSTNANLSTLGITPKEYDFSGFSSSKTSYSVTVPNDVDSLKVAYKTADSKATVKVTGNTDLEVGTNNIKVVVTAEDGKTTKTYTIKVTKLATEDSKPGNVIDEENDLDLCLTSLSVKGLELTPEFSSNVYSYETTIDMDNNDMSEVTVEAVANDKKANVEITGNTNLVEGENLINIVVKASNSSEQTVYQITVNKVSQASEIVSSNNIIDKIKNIKREYLIIGGFIFIVVVILAIIIINHIRNKKYYEYEDEENEEDFYNNNLNTFEDGEANNNLVEELFKKRNNGEELNKEEKETIEDIEKENDRIFNKPKKGETVEYNELDEEEQEDEEKPNYIEERQNRRKKGKHF